MWYVVFTSGLLPGVPCHVAAGPVTYTLRLGYVDSRDVVVVVNMVVYLV